MTLTPQDIFTTVWNHLKQQGQPSRGDRACRYRSDTGLSCTVGCLLDDDTARKFDAYPSTAIGVIPMALLPEALRPHIPLLKELQVAHDERSSVLSWWLKDWPRRMRFIAEDYNLEVPQ